MRPADAQREKASTGDVTRVNRNPAGCDTKDGVSTSARGKRARRMDPIGHFSSCSSSSSSFSSPAPPPPLERILVTSTPRATCSSLCASARLPVCPAIAEKSQRVASFLISFGMGLTVVSNLLSGCWRQRFCPRPHCATSTLVSTSALARNSG